MDVTRQLAECRSGSPEALDKLLSLVYAELRRTAAMALRSNRPDDTLQPTALVHEAYMALIDQRERSWVDRQHFFSIAAGLMRRILLRHAEKRRASKRGGGIRPVTLVEIADSPAEPALDVIELDRVLKLLHQRDPFKHRVVEQRFFSGLSLDEIAVLEGVSERTVQRAWSFAKSWIRKELQAE